MDANKFEIRRTCMEWALRTHQEQNGDPKALIRTAAEYEEYFRNGAPSRHSTALMDTAIIRETGFLGRECDRIAEGLHGETCDSPRWRELYAAQQALKWAIDPRAVKSPADMLNCPGEDSVDLEFGDLEGVAYAAAHRKAL